MATESAGRVITGRVQGGEVESGSMRRAERLTVMRGGGQAAAMSSPEIVSAKKKLPLAQLAMAGAVLAVMGAGVVYAVGGKTVLATALHAKTAVLEWVSAAGPLVFFGAMALLPGVGVPNSPFALAAGPVFGERLGLPVVTLLCVAAITINLALTYWLARRWLRPVCGRVLERFGYKLPVVESGDVTDLIVLIRVTPVLPFFAQNYLLGLADVPFVRYLLISLAIQGSLNVGFILFGEALNHGRGGMVLTAGLLIAMLVVGTHWVRKHYGKKKSAAASPA